MIIKYDRIEAMKNKCYPITFGKAFFLMVLCVFILIFIYILLPLILKNSFSIIFHPLIRILILLLILLGSPILLLKWYLNKIKWFSTSFIFQNNNWYLVELINHRFIKGAYKGNVIYPEIDVLDDHNYINMLDQWFKQEKIDGEVTKLENILFIKESKKYYYYSYVNKGIQKKLKIPKAYNNLTSILK